MKILLPWFKDCQHAIGLLSVFTMITLFSPLFCPASLALDDDVKSVGQEQQEEKDDLKSMRDELNSIKNIIKESDQTAADWQSKLASKPVKEFHLFARTAEIDKAGKKEAVPTYNGHVPGPDLSVQEGDMVRIILHNQLDQPTRLKFQGISPVTSNNPDSDIIDPGSSRIYMFTAGKQGVYRYAASDKDKQLCGSIVVSPALPGGNPKSP